LAHSVFLCLQSVANEHVNRVAYAYEYVYFKQKQYHRDHRLFTYLVIEIYKQ